MDPNAQYSRLMAYVAAVPDPRGRRGRRYPWSFLLAVICGALVSGFKTVRGMAQWAREHRDELLDQPWPERPKRRRVPSVATLLRVVCFLDVAELEHQMEAWGQVVADADPVSGHVHGPNGEELVGQACDGKTIRGSVGVPSPSQPEPPPESQPESQPEPQPELPPGPPTQTHVISIVQQGSGVTLAQRATAGKGTEQAAVQALLAERDLHGVVMTFDALHTQKKELQQVLDQGGDYVVLAKENQPTLYATLKLFFEGPPPTRLEDDRLRYTQGPEAGHGRLETRTLVTSAALNAYLADWPGVQQVFQRTCRRVIQRTGEIQLAVEYGLTSLSRARALPEQLAQLRRGEWTIENRSHYVRDDTLGEDRCRVRRGDGAQALAALRNGVLAALRYDGWENIADAVRHFGASVAKALRVIGVVAT